MIQNRDYGIHYGEVNCGAYKGYIKFCGLGIDESFVFREILENRITKIIRIKDGREYYSELINEKVAGYCEEANGTKYILTVDPCTIICLSKNGRFEWKISDEFNPLFIAVSNNYILITGLKPRLLVYEKNTFELVLDLDLTQIHAIEPIYVSIFDEKKLEFIVTDSQNHTVKIINSKLNILWEYGLENCAGEEVGYLCVPVEAIRFGAHILIAQQRLHNIIFVSKDKQIMGQIGKTNYVGMKNGLFWAPQICILNNKLHIIMCKGGNIYICKFDYDTKKTTKVFGSEIINYSDLNFPRGSDYCPDTEEIAVADTYHNRILIYSSDGNLKEAIHSTVEGKLQWPRCVKWVDKDHIIIADSKNNRIIYISLNATEQKEFIANDNFAKGEWIQSVSIRDNTLLIAYESSVSMYSKVNGNLIWRSPENIKMRDIHCADFDANGGILVADTGNNRIIHFCEKSVVYIDHLHMCKRDIYLSKPRCVSNDKNNYFIVNSGTSQIYICDTHTLEIKRIYGNERGIGEHRLSIPRWITYCGDKYFLISDTDNHRIIIRKILF